jgi:predicted kinase
LRLGQNVIVDAAFLNHEDRLHFHALAKRLNVDFVIVDTCAESDELLRRVRLRQHDAGDASEADANVLRYQFDNAGPLTAEELEWTINVVTDTAIDADAVVEQIAATRR